MHEGEAEKPQNLTHLEQHRFVSPSQKNVCECKPELKVREKSLWDFPDEYDSYNTQFCKIYLLYENIFILEHRFSTVSGFKD